MKPPPIRQQLQGLPTTRYYNFLNTFRQCFPRFLCGESRIVCLRRTKVRFSMAQLLQLNIWNEKSVQ